MHKSHQNWVKSHKIHTKDLIFFLIFCFVIISTATTEHPVGLLDPSALHAKNKSINTSGLCRESRGEATVTSWLWRAQVQTRFQVSGLTPAELVSKIYQEIYPSWKVLRWFDVHHVGYFWDIKRLWGGAVTTISPWISSRHPSDFYYSLDTVEPRQPSNAMQHINKLSSSSVSAAPWENIM